MSSTVVSNGWGDPGATWFKLGIRGLVVSEGHGLFQLQ